MHAYWGNAVQPQIIIARYSVWKSLPIVLFGAGLTIGAYVPPIIMHQWPIEFLTSARASAPAFVFGWMVGPFIFPFYYHTLVQILFRKRVAIWAEGDMIMHVSKREFCVNRQEVASVALIRIKRVGLMYPFIRMELKSGGEKLLPVLPLVDDRDAVIARLRGVIAAPTSDRVQASGGPEL
jgi:hypothetical protein